MVQPATVLDARMRPLRDLRISVTDRCNFRCRYCMPRESFESSSYLRRSELLSFEEIRRVAERFVGLGVQKIRLTGGEPLLRRELPQLVRSLSELGVDLALTTNGVLLARQADALRQAGLTRLSVSLDALDEAVFQQLCDTPAFRAQDVLAGIARAEAAGFPPPKINCVVRRGVNDHQIVPLAQEFLGRGHVLRFIEYMDVGERNGWQSRDVLLGEEILERLSHLGSVVPLDRLHPSDVATRYLVAGQLEVGVITSISKPFCHSCSRLRLSADGGLYTCLFSGIRHELKARLRRGDSNSEIDDYLAQLWGERLDRYSEQREASARERGAGVSAHPRRLPVLPRVEMSFIGG